MEDPPRKKARGQARAGSKKNKKIKNCESSLESSFYLTYDILRIIFQYLNGMDLSSAAMVCRSWLEAADNEKRTRSPSCFIELHTVWDEEKEEESLKVINVEKLRIKPSIGLMFVHAKRVEDKEGWFAKLLPTNCEIIMLHTTGIIINKREVERKIRNHALRVCALLPEVPNMTINMLKLSLVTENFPNILKNTIGTATSCHKSVCLMLFCNYFGRDIAMRTAKCLKSRSKKYVVSLWGGVVSHLHVRNKDNKNCIDDAVCVAVVISGSVQTWSTVVDSNCVTKEQVEAQLKSLKDRVKLRKHSVGFMFACQARGTTMYNEANVESSIFKRLFPDVPLVGCFGDGEFGKNTISNSELIGESARSKSKRTKPWYNELSTVFMILTYG